MFCKLRAAILAFSVLCVSQPALGRPLGSETPIKRVQSLHHVRAQVVRAQVLPRDTSPTCSGCGTITVKVSGTATASAAFTVTVGSPASTATPGALGNFGSCSVPQIEYGAGFDGRKETSFQPVDKVSYNHDSADDIAVITEFICGALANTCDADATAQATCANAQVAAAAEPPQEGVDADVFNAVFGIQTNFKDVEALNSTGDPIAGSATNTISADAPISTAVDPASTDSQISTSSTAVAPNQTNNKPAPSGSQKPAKTGDATRAPLSTLVTAVTSVESADPAPTATPAGTSNNLQPFTGALGGIAAPAVVASGSQFQVEGNSVFNKETDALARSCDVQKNACANAANASGDKGSLTVAACGAQQSACIAAGGA
ncbi:hypothetical protein DFH06DRAFT_638834 [Mycena polygramma]|nr:hypothetical protein DFH06DRAFT_638834 [Mycena polygramma]